MATAIAIIENLGHEDHGFAWGSERNHRLIMLDDSLCQEVQDLVGDSAVVSDVAHEVAAIIRGRLGLSDSDIAVVDTEEGVTDEWPSAGDPNSWCDDVWLGLADYLSYRAWARVVGGSCYTLTDEDAAACVHNCGAEAVRAALEYVTDDDPIYAPLLRALGEQA